VPAYLDLSRHDVSHGLCPLCFRHYYPDLADGALQPGYAGIRPKVVPQGASAGDFLIHGPEHHGITGLVNLFGIESPGLTASLAIAERVSSII